MLVLTSFSVCVAITMLLVAWSSGRSTRRVTMARRLRLARGERILAATPSAPALRESRIGPNSALMRLVSGVRFMHRLSDALERAGWRLNVMEFIAIVALTAAAGSMAVRLFLPVLTPLGALVGFVLPLLLLRRAVGQRRDRFVKQLVEALTLASSALKAGVGLIQALDKAAEQLKPPIADELHRTLRDIQLGATPDEAFTALADRIRSDDLDIVVTAIIIQRTSGGNLTEILDNVAFTMRERVRIRGEIKTLTTQQQFSGYLVALIPIGLLVLFNMINHSYLEPMFTTAIGHVMLATGGALQVIGFFVIRKIVNIEV